MRYGQLRFRLPGVWLTTLSISLALFAGCAGNGIGNGDGNDNGNGNGEVGGVSGTVSNSLTGAGLAGATVTVEPAVEGVEITTDDDGAYFSELPVGIYTLTYADDNYTSQSTEISVNDRATTPVDVALVPVAAVVVTASVEGDAEPDASLIATVTVEVLDGSATVESYAWTQSNSVTVTIVDPDDDTTAVVLPDATTYKDLLFVILSEPPISEDQLPPNVPVPEGEEFPGGLQDRFEVVGLNPFALEETGLVTLSVAVTTSSGTFSDDVEIHTELPWKVAAGIEDVPIQQTVLLHGKTQDNYDWALNPPAGSDAALTDADEQNPEFTPDVSGLYRVTVTNTTPIPNEDVVLDIYAGTWEGVITGQDADGRPEADNCTVCHNGDIAPDMFTPWAQTGHAEIFTNNLNTSTHYGEGCFPCHTVGFDPAVTNEGIDEASDYQDFLDSGLINNPSPDNWTTVLNDYPETAQLANIQCENCHGPQNDAAHTMGDPRLSLSSDVCATCHGEPLRHARFQQWQLSGHANYELAIDEGESGNCSRCHTANGFLAWLPVLEDDDPNTSPLDDVVVTWTPDETHPQTCVTCHDPHAVGTTTGVTTDATVRISGDTPPLIAGFTVFGAGNGAICMTCHNSRRGLRNDDTFEATTAAGDAARAPHGSSQTDVLMGENAYLVNVGIRGSHSLVEDSCVNCHMEQTPPPDVLAYNLGGTNHTFFASETICANCHDELDADGLEAAFQASSDQLQSLQEAALLTLITDLTDAGNTIDLNGEATIVTASQITDLVFGESRGRQAITVSLLDGTIVGPTRMNDVRVLNAGGTDIGELYDFADDRVIKAGWNYNLANNDGSKGIHNPSFVFEFLDAGIDALNQLSVEASAG